MSEDICDCETCKGETTEEGRKACREMLNRYLKKQRDKYE